MPPPWGSKETLVTANQTVEKTDPKEMETSTEISSWEKENAPARDGFVF